LKNNTKRMMLKKTEKKTEETLKTKEQQKLRKNIDG
jgi:hypothetical protein